FCFLSLPRPARVSLSLHDALPIYPLLVWLFGIEVSVQQIWRNPANFSFVRAIFLDSDTANQAQFFHQPLDSLVVQEKSSTAKYQDRKSTRLNSSHVSISYAVFCLK